MFKPKILVEAEQTHLKVSRKQFIKGVGLLAMSALVIGPSAYKQARKVFSPGYGHGVYGFIDQSSSY